MFFEGVFLFFRIEETHLEPQPLEFFAGVGGKLEELGASRLYLTTKASLASESGMARI